MMGLRPLEFADCLSDSPWFRQNLHEHESVLEEAHRNIETIESQCRDLIKCTKKLSDAQRAFAKSLKDFRFITIGTTQTDDERKIGECINKFADFINQIEDHRQKIIEDSEKDYIEPLRNFRAGCIGKVLHKDKKKYEKESSKFYAALEKHLHLSTARKNDFKEADAHLGLQQRNFCKCSLDYVTAIQSAQERMKFEFVDTLSSFLYSWLTFYHVGHVTHEDFKPFLSEVRSKIEKAKESFDETKEHYEQLKEKILAAHLKSAVFTCEDSNQSGSDSGIRPMSSSIKQGYVFVQEKSKIPKTIGRDVLSNRWTKCYCVYQKETRIFTMITMNSSARTDMKGALDQSVSFKLKSCTRRASDSIDKRFCFDVLAMDRTEPITLQALSEEDRRQWLDAMDGREPIYSPGTGLPSNTFGTTLDEVGFEFVRKCLEAIEARGMKEQGLYRNCGVTSKVQKLMQIGLDKRRSLSEKLNFSDDVEWETKTVSSAVKTYLRNLPEPLMTFDLHNQFINAAKLDSVTRITHIHYYVHQLPKIHIEMLRMIIEHLVRVAKNSNENLMTVGNLGVCFGPTLLRPKEETMAAIMDIKFCNVIVEVLISNFDLIFNTQPINIDRVPYAQKTLQQDCISFNSFPFLDSCVTPADFHRPTLPDATASRSDVNVSAERRLVTSPFPQRSRPTLHIYDQVSDSFIDSTPDSPKSPSSQKMTASFTKASTSTSDSVNTTGHQASDSAKLSPIHHMNATNLEPYSATTIDLRSRGRRSNEKQQQQRTTWLENNSSDSANSVSGSDESLSPNRRPCRAISLHHNAVTAAFPKSHFSANTPSCNISASESKAANSGVTRTANSSFGDSPHRTGKNVALLTDRDRYDCPPSVSHKPLTQSSSGTGTHKNQRSTSKSTVNEAPGFQTSSRRVKTLYSCTAGHDTELSFEPGNIITNVYESKEEGWLVGTLNGKTGLIPANYVEPLP